MKYRLLALFMSLNAFYATAQKVTFEKGYVVNDKGDTLRGEIKFNPKKEQDCYSKVVFKDESGALKNYKPNKAKAYGFNDQRYVAMEFEGEPKFLRVLAEGEINLYKMMFEDISMNKEVVAGEYFVSHKADDKKRTAVKEGKFKKQMTELMKDNTEFINNYEDEKTFNEANAAEVIKKYNAWKAGK
ncbi:MAG: hypothetical protein V4635_05345 [Bacteroidota bacterium]